MSSPELVPSAPGSGDGSALRTFLNRYSTVYEEEGAVIPWSVMRYGVFSCTVMIGLGLFGLPMTGGHGKFFIAFGAAAGGLASALHGLAVPWILLGLAALGLDVYLLKVPTTGEWRAAVPIELALAAVQVTLAVLLLAIVVFNLAIWIVIGIAILAVIGVLLMALGGG
jgi:hypothetical protein